MPHCSKCGVEKAADEFYRERGKPRRDCKQCNKASAMERYRRAYAADPRKWIERSKRWHAEHPLPEYQRRWIAENIDHVRAHRRSYELRTAKSATRRALRFRSIPVWADRSSILAIYAQAKATTRATGHEHHVDHIVPLRSPLVCGLHVESNLQVLTKSENSRKKNTRWPEMPQ